MRRIFIPFGVSVFLLGFLMVGCGSSDEAQSPPVQPMQVAQGVVQPNPALPAASPQQTQVQPVQPQAVQPQNPVGAMAGAIQQVATGQNAPQPGTVTQIPWQNLSQALPTQAPGWALKGQIEGRSMNMMGISVSEASCELTQGNMEAKVQLVDTTMNPMIAMPFNVARTVRIDSSDERVSPVNYGTYPATQKFDKKRNKAEVIIMVHNRVMATITVKNAPDETAATNLGQYINFAHLAQIAGG